MKTITSLLLITISSFLLASDPIHLEQKHISQVMVDNFIDGILESDDMTVKMPVLKAAFRDSTEWEKGVKRLIEAEEWEWAKMYFVEFYWSKVRKGRDEEFINSAIEELRKSPELWESVHPIDTMMFRTKNESSTRANQP